MLGMRRTSPHRRQAGVRRAAWPLVVLLLAAGAGTASAAVTSPQRPSDEDLRALTEQGRRIVSYHEAIARARPLFKQQGGEDGDPVREMVVERAGVWHVVFLKRVGEAADAKGWALAADGVFNLRVGEMGKLEMFDPPKPAPADAMAVMRAIDVARSRAHEFAALAAPPFDEAVFRDKAGVLTVSLQSKAPARGGVRFAADLRVVASVDGTKAVEVAPIHGPGEAIDVLAGDGRTPTLHSHARGDLPTATDVAQVIANPAVAPHLVLTPLWMFRIEADGGVTWLGRNEVPPVAPGGGR